MTEEDFHVPTRRQLATRVVKATENMINAKRAEEAHRHLDYAVNSLLDLIDRSIKELLEEKIDEIYDTPSECDTNGEV